VKTEDLIVELARNAGPVRRLPGPSARMWRWTILALLTSVTAAVLIGWRADLTSALTRPPFLLLAVAATGAGLMAALAAFALSVPGAERSRVGRWLPIGAVGVWLLLNLANLWLTPGLPASADDAVHAACAARVKAVAALPAFAILLMVRRAAPLEPLWTSVLAACAAGSIALATIQFICPIDAPVHAIVSHLTPTLIFVFVAATLGWRAMMT
jgi:hypothetical protein